MSVLLVNIDHIATLRNQRGISYPNLLEAARIVEANGASGITAHLREDRRHIKDKDIYDLKKHVRGSLNLEMAATIEMQQIALDVAPTKACIVPEKREELTTEGGLDLIKTKETLLKLIPSFKANNIETSLFIEPDRETIKLAYDLGAEVIELHTGAYANAYMNGENFKTELNKIKEAIMYGKALGLKINLGHGLDYENMLPLLKLKEVNFVSEYNIGFSIISMSVFLGLAGATKKILDLIKGV